MGIFQDDNGGIYYHKVVQGAQYIIFIQGYATFGFIKLEFTTCANAVMLCGDKKKCHLMPTYTDSLQAC